MDHNGFMKWNVQKHFGYQAAFHHFHQNLILTFKAAHGEAVEGMAEKVWKYVPSDCRAECKAAMCFQYELRFL